MENGCHVEFNFDQALLNEICDKFLQFYNEFIDKSLEDKKYVKNIYISSKLNEKNKYVIKTE